MDTDSGKAIVTISALTGGPVAAGAGFAWVGFPILVLGLGLAGVFYGTPLLGWSRRKVAELRSSVVGFQSPIILGDGGSDANSLPKPAPKPVSIEGLPEEYVEILDEFIDAPIQSIPADEVVRALIKNGHFEEVSDLHGNLKRVRINTQLRPPLLERRDKRGRTWLGGATFQDRQFLMLLTGDGTHSWLANEVYQAGQGLGAHRGPLFWEDTGNPETELVRIREGYHDAIRDFLGEELSRDRIEIDLNFVSPSGNRGSGA